MNKVGAIKMDEWTNGGKDKVKNEQGRDGRSWEERDKSGRDTKVMDEWREEETEVERYGQR